MDEILHPFQTMTIEAQMVEVLADEFGIPLPVCVTLGSSGSVIYPEEECFKGLFIVCKSLNYENYYYEELLRENKREVGQFRTQWQSNILMDFAKEHDADGVLWFDPAEGTVPIFLK